MALTDKLDAIADSIRAKTGKTALMTLDEMPAEIASIKSGGSGVDESKVYGDAYIVLSKSINAYYSDLYSGIYDIDLSDYITDVSQIVSIFCSSDLYNTSAKYNFASYWTRYNGDSITSNSSRGFMDGMKGSNPMYPEKGSASMFWDNLYSGTKITFNTTTSVKISKLIIRYNTEV